MGRRKKAAKKVVKKRRPTLSKTFKCFFCSSDKSVECKIDLRKSRTGTMQCSVCHAKFERPAHELTQPIDLYHQWLDETQHRRRKAVAMSTAERFLFLHHQLSMNRKRMALMKTTRMRINRNYSPFCMFNPTSNHFQ